MTSPDLSESTATTAGAKAPDALRTIGEVAALLGLRQHVLRYWEDQFPMLKPLKRSGGRRYYRSEDVRLVETIDRLVHREGYTLKGARAVLADKSAVAPVPPIAAPAPAALPADNRAGLLAIRAALAEALAAG